MEPPRPATPPREICAAAARCGGCALLGVDPREQLEFKREVVLRALRDVPGVPEHKVAPTLAAPRARGYRGRAKLAVAQVRGDVLIGLFRPGSNLVEDAAPCVVHRPVIQGAIEPLRGWIAAHGLGAPAGPIKHVDLREVAGRRVHLTLVSTARRQAFRRSTIADLRERMGDTLASLALNHSPERTAYIFGERTDVLVGGDRFVSPLPRRSTFPSSLQVPILGFAQLDADQVPRVARRMLSHLRVAPTGTWYDLYCGVGTWGLSLAHRMGGARVGRIVGVEEHPGAVACARANAAELGLAGGTEFIADRVEHALPRLVRRSPPDVVILNPARGGCREGVLRALTDQAAAAMAYLSCNPYTLARDLTWLTRHVYQVDQVIPLDMMPQTDQVEALALLVARR